MGSFPSLVIPRKPGVAMFPLYTAWYNQGDSQGDDNYQLSQLGRVGRGLNLSVSRDRSSLGVWRRDRGREGTSALPSGGPGAFLTRASEVLPRGLRAFRGVGIPARALWHRARGGGTLSQFSSRRVRATFRNHVPSLTFPSRSSSSIFLLPHYNYYLLLFLPLSFFSALTIIIINNLRRYSGLKLTNDMNFYYQ